MKFIHHYSLAHTSVSSSSPAHLLSRCLPKLLHCCRAILPREESPTPIPPCPTVLSSLAFSSSFSLPSPLLEPVPTPEPGHYSIPRSVGRVPRRRSFPQRHRATIGAAMDLNVESHLPTTVSFVQRLKSNLGKVLMLVLSSFLCVPRVSTLVLSTAAAPGRLCRHELPCTAPHRRLHWLRSTLLAAMPPCPAAALAHCWRLASHARHAGGHGQVGSSDFYSFDENL